MMSWLEVSDFSLSHHTVNKICNFFLSVNHVTSKVTITINDIIKVISFSV
jgi:hypothetical protein